MQSYHALRLIFLCWGMSFVSLAWSQPDSLWVEGKIVNEETQQPLVGANILIEGTKNGTISNPDGSFGLWIVQPDTFLQISFTGFATKRFSAQELKQLGVIPLSPGVLGEEILITALPLNRWSPRGTPTPTILLEPKQFNPIDPYNLQSALQGLPGIQSQAGSLNTTRLIFRGLGTRTPFSTDQVRLYFDDIPLTNGSGESTLEEIEASAIGQLAAYQSPGQPIYGNELGGTIIMDSPKSLPNAATALNPTFSLSAGSFGRNQQSVGLAVINPQHPQRHFNWLSFARTASEGYRDNNNYRRLSGYWSGRIRLDSVHSSYLSYLMHWRSLEAGIPSSLNATDFTERPSAAAGNWAAVSGNEDHQNLMGGLSWQVYQLNPQASRWTIGQKTTLFAGRHTNTEIRPFNVLDETNQFQGARMTWTLSTADYRDKKGEHRWQLGGEFYRERYDQNLLETLDEGVIGALFNQVVEYRQEYFGFLVHRFSTLTNRFSVQTSLNWRQKSYRWEGATIETEDRYHLKGILSPSLYLNFRPFPEKGEFIISFSGGRASSMPNNEEALVNAGVGSILNPEQGWSIDFRLEHIIRRLHWRLGTYQIWVRDALVARPTADDQLLFINGGSTLHRGIEGYLRHQFLDQRQWRGHIDFTISLGNFRFDQFIDDDQDYSGNLLPGVPQWNGQSRLQLEHQGWYTQLTHETQGRQALNDANTGFSDGFSLLHWRIGYRYLLPSKALQKHPLHCFIGINNILDERYAAMVQVNARGFGGNLPRHFYAGLPRFVYVGIALDLRDLGN